MSADGALATQALAMRLRAIAPMLLRAVPERVVDPAGDAARMIFALAESAVAEPTNSRIWLLLSGVGAAYPTRDEVDEARRTIELSAPEEVAEYLLETGLHRIRLSGEPTATVEVLAGRVIVDVDFTARHDLHTGIQRVVRQTLPFWNADRQITTAAWTRNQGTLRLLDPAEATRVYDWFSSAAANGSTGSTRGSQPSSTGFVRPADPRLIIPWNSVIVLPEVPPVEAATRIAALGAYSNNKVVAIGYDTIPLVSADTVPLEEPTKFMPYLAAMKFADRIGAISGTAAEEFRCFTSMLSTQGLTGPKVTSVPLPAEIGDTTAVAVVPEPPTTKSADIVVVGSHDPRKNHLAILHAAEILWQEGLEFTVTFIGSGGSNAEFFHRVEVLQYRGRPVRIRVAVPEAELKQAVASARFTMFPSIHEGYGLPVAESISLGTPVITTNYGSTAEIAADGGAITVDPRDDADVTAAMRRLLTDDAELASLRSQIRSRAGRSWQQYADELWNALVEPALADLAGSSDHHGR